MQHKWEDSSFGAAPNNEIPLLLSSPHSTQSMGEAPASILLRTDSGWEFVWGGTSVK